jgi:Fic family protein
MSKIDDATKELLRLAFESNRRVEEAILALIDGVTGERTDYLTVPQYARRFNFAESTVRRHLLEGGIPGAHKRGSQWVIPVKEAS